jgi:hypothetical protein
MSVCVVVAGCGSALALKCLGDVQDSPVCSGHGAYLPLLAAAALLGCAGVGIGSARRSWWVACLSAVLRVVVSAATIAWGQN